MMRRLLLATGAALLSGCTWAASSAVCRRPPSTSPPLAATHLLVAEDAERLAEPGRIRSLISIDVWSDGTLVYSDGSYPWCRDLGASRIAAVRDRLEDLARVEFADEAGDSPESWNRGTMIEVAFGDAGKPATAFAHRLVRFPATDSTADDPAWPALDAFFCLLESRLGSRYRRQLTTEFEAFLAARGRIEPCRQVHSGE